MRSMPPPSYRKPAPPTREPRIHDPVRAFKVQLVQLASWRIQANQGTKRGLRKAASGAQLCLWRRPEMAMIQAHIINEFYERKHMGEHDRAPTR
jgi:hypothetical protein